jgi:hypothetical protein
MEGMFWGTLIAMAPLWAWVPLGAIEIVLILTGFPWYVKVIPVALYVLTFASMIYGMLDR